MFQDITKESGINYKGASYGVAWGDYNNDGFTDLWVGNHGFGATLYQNNGDRTFTDVTLTVFGAQPQGDFHGTAWADFDHDGDLDLIQLVGADAGKSSLTDPQIANRLYVNDQGVLSDRGIELGLGYIGSRGRNPLWFDYNNDGLLDLLQGAGQRGDEEVPATIFRQDSTTGSFIDLQSELELDLTPTRFGVLSDLTGDRTSELVLLNPFTGISIFDTTTLTDITNTLLTAEYHAEDFISEDFNGDLLPDLYLTRSGLSDSAFVTPDSTTLNLQLNVEASEQGVTFKTEGAITLDFWTFGFAGEEIDPENIYIGTSALTPEELNLPLGTANETITELTLTLDPQDSQVQGIASAETREEEGLYLGYNSTLEEWELYLATPDQDLVAAIIKSEQEVTDTKAIAFNNDLEPNPDQLLLNDRSGLIDHTDASGLNSVRIAGVSTVAGDFDNDMDLDLYVVTTNPAGNEPNVLYDNQGDGTFLAVPDLGAAEGSKLGIGNTVSTSDYNNDGFLDLFLTNGDFPHLLNQDAPYQLLENEGNDHHWLEIDLEGVLSNQDAIGSKVYVTAGGITQLRQQSGGMHDQVQNDSRLHFGLADNTMVEKITIEWASGVVQNMQNVTADQILEIIEPNPIVP